MVLQNMWRGDVSGLYHRYGLDYVELRYMNVYGPRQDYKGATLR